MSIYDKYETIIGLEVHVQLSTKSKAFCSDATTFGASPNSQVSIISLAHPGTLPRTNKTHIHSAAKLGLALGCKISPESRFDRKNYFYADLPKGYQITQDRMPICVGGSLDILLKDGFRNIGIHHIHMEEDAGKSIHDVDPKYSLVDLNRAGVPLLEVVTEPDLRSAEEVDAFMTAMRQMVRYLDISDGNMEEGSMRCDVNISVRLKGTEKLGERCEVKNVNSMKFARRAIDFEVKRQIDLLESGGRVLQQTLNFDPVSGTTSPLRSKENAHDYRYFPEPDLPPVVLDENVIRELKATLPALPKSLYQQFVHEFKLSHDDAVILIEDRDFALYFLGNTQQSKSVKATANLFINKIRPWLSEHKKSIADFPMSDKQIQNFAKLIEAEKVTASIAYSKLFPAMMEGKKELPSEVAEQLGLLKNTDSSELEALVDACLAANPKEVKAYQNGKKKLMGFFMGELMKMSRGTADPKMGGKLLREKLDIRY